MQIQLPTAPPPAAAIARGWEIGTLRVPPLKQLTNFSRRHKYSEKADAADLLRECLAHDPSDIHINVGHPVILEIHGRMARITDHELDWSEFETFARLIRDKEGATSMLSQSEDWDGAFIMRDASLTRRRLRVNMTALNSIRHSSSGSLVLRPLTDLPPTPEQVGLSADLIQSCFPKDGAVYVVGPTGSGKTSTFGALIRHAAETGAYYHGHLRTYESPPEFDLEALSSEHLLITQVAINVPWGLRGFSEAIRNAMRAHPAAIMVGEVRDYETTSAVVEAALTGHPVFGTVHSANPATAFQRLITRYPHAQQSAALYDLVSTTRTIVAQRLVKRLDGKRSAIREWVTFDDELRKRLLNLANPGEVNVAISQCIRERKQSFEDAVLELLRSEEISPEVALEYGVR